MNPIGYELTWRDARDQPQREWFTPNHLLLALDRKGELDGTMLVDYRLGRPGPTDIRLAAVYPSERKGA